MLDAYYMTLDVLHNTHRTRSAQGVGDQGEGDHLVRDAAVLKAGGHMADRHVIALDHSCPLEARGRLAHDAEAAPAAQAIMHGGGGDHVDSCDRCTSMKTVLVSGIGLTPDLQLGARHRGVVTGRAADAADARRGAPKAFLRHMHAPFSPALGWGERSI